MKGTRQRRLAFGAATVAATFLSFPHPLGGRVVDGGLVFAWLVPALLLLTVRDLPPRRAALWGFFTGWAAHTAVLHWIYVVTVVYGHAPVVVGFVAPAALASYIALFSAAFAGGAAWLAGRGAGGPFSLALLWTVLDHLRSFFFTGFPWATLGYAQHENLPLLGLAPYTAVYGLSFLTVLASVALLDLAGFLGGGRRTTRSLMIRPALVAFAVVALSHLTGLFLYRADAAGSGQSVRVAVLQGNIDQGVKWSNDWAERILGIYEDLSRRAVLDGAELIVWPETSVPGSILTDEGLRERMGLLARELGAGLVVGGVGIDGVPDSLRFTDSAFFVDPRGRLLERYDKSHLVPFGEYVPFRSLLGLFLSAVARGMATTDVTEGARPRAVDLEGFEVQGSVLTAGIPICYELLFPDLMRRFVAGGGALLLAITNDAWYGRTGAPYQFLAMTAVRSAETRVWTARAANTGVSAIIDHRGRVRHRTKIFERGLIVEDVEVRKPPWGGSFYTRHGDVFAWGCWLALGVIVLRARGRGRS